MRLTVMSSEEFVEAVMAFDDFGTSTLLEPFEWEVDGRRGTTMKAINEYWTSGQRQANALHEISYRACFKPQLPAFFISRLTEEGDAVYDPFMGRGTTPLEARLLGRRPMGNDINPLSQVLLAPRLNPPGLKAIERRLEAIDLSHAEEVNEDLLHFFHRDTLREIIALKEYLLRRQDAGELDEVDAWIRMVAINRLTGHSSGFFSVYTLPPNQAVTAARQQRINEQRNQIPAYRAIKPRILKKSKTLLKDWKGQGLHAFQHDLSPTLTTSDSRDVSDIPEGSAKLVVTSPPFLDVVDYQGDNWMRCWFIGLDSSTIEISQLKSIQRWEDAMTDVLRDLKRIVEVGGHIAFEVGEVRGGKVLLEEHVVRCGVQAGLEPVIILINDQEFTKTANAWGVDNDKKGTNTNRIVLFEKGVEGMVTAKIEVKTSENSQYEELNFEVASGKGVGRATKKNKSKTDKSTLNSIKQHAEFHFAVKQEDKNVGKCFVDRPVYVLRGKEKGKHETALRKKKGWTRSLSTISHLQPSYFIRFDVCKLAEAYGLDEQLIRELLLDSRWVAKATEAYVAEATGGKATFDDKEADVVVENYNPEYLRKIEGAVFPSR